MRRYVMGLQVVSTLATLLMISSSGLPRSALAAPPAVEITPMAGYRGSGGFKDPDTDATLDLDESSSFGLILNVDHDENTQWEFMLSRQSTEMQTGAAFMGDRLFDLDVIYATAGGIYVWRDPKVEPFVGAGIGFTHMAPDDTQYDSETRLLFSLVGGYKFLLTDSIGLRIEVRGYQTLMSSDTAVFCGNGSCVARVESDGFGQLEFNAGLVVRF